MNRLFWKFLLSFWLIVLGVSIASFLVAYFGLKNYYQDEMGKQIIEINQEIIPIKNHLSNGNTLVALSEYYDLPAYLQSKIDIYQQFDDDLEIALTYQPKLESNLFFKQFWQVDQVKSWLGENYLIQMRPSIIIVWDELLYLLLPYGLFIFLLSSLLCYFFASMLTSPIKKISKKANLVAKGDLNAIKGITSPSRYTNDELGDLAKTFQMMMDSLLESYEQKDRLIRDMAHELRSPITRIRFANELIISSAKSQKKLNLIVTKTKQIEKDIERMELLIQQSLDLFNNKKKYTQQDLTQIIEEVIKDCQFNHPKVNFEFFKPKENCQGYFLENTDLIFINLLENAMKYSGSETIKIELSKSDCFEIEISDFGKGVDENELKNIFMPYARIYQEEQQKNNGFGLGLAIAKQIVEQQDGNIKARNEDGLSVKVQLPIKNKESKSNN